MTFSTLNLFSDGFCGQLGHGDKRPQVLPKQVEQGGLEDECVQSVSCGSRHTLAVTEDGEVFSWGMGHFGALGRSYTPFEYDADATIVAFGGEEALHRVDLGPGEAVPQVPQRQHDEGGLAPDLLEHLNLINNMSLDDSSDQCIPKLIDSLQHVKCVGVSAGHRHSLILDNYGGIYSFGSGKTGCLGHGDFESQIYPVRISHFDTEGIKVLKISAGCDISMAVDTFGKVYAFGLSKGGRLGLPVNANVCLPRQVRVWDADNDVPMKAVDIDCGYVHSLILGINGTLFECGKVGTNGAADGQIDGGLDEEKKEGHGTLYCLCFG